MKNVLRMSQMLSSSSEMRSAGLKEKKHEPEPVAPILNEAESFSFGSDLEKVLHAHREVPITPGALVGRLTQLPLGRLCNRGTNSQLVHRSRFY